MAKQKTLAAPARTEFGKGAARRARRAGSIPAVVYGHNTDPLHITVNNLDFLAILREEGINAVISLETDKKSQLALVKAIAQNPVTRDIEHVDFLNVKRGEKVEVEVPLVVEGDVKPGAAVITETDQLRVEADALNIPEEIIVSVEDMEAGTTITAGDVTLPKGSTLADDPELLLINITFAEVADVTTSTAETDVADAAEDEASSED